MFLWMTYVIAVSLLLGWAALAAEHAARLNRSSTRWIWALAICLSLLMPTVIASVSVQFPNVFSPTVSQRAVALRNATSSYLAPQRLFASNANTPVDWGGLDSLLKTSWVAVSMAMLAGLVANGLYLFSRKRRWTQDILSGTSVYVAADAGPAVVGVLRPTIVVPQWLLTAPPAHQHAVMAHEQSHLDAGDTQLFTAALFLLVFMPWNLPLWWQLHRLRHAIEVDCDRRVLRAGCDATAYGETLVAVGERHSTYVGTVAAMAESKSFLEQRIIIMVRTPGRWRRATVTTLLCVSVALVAVAAQVSPPDAAANSSSMHREISVDSRVLARYVGSYKLNDNAVVTVTLRGQQLIAQLTGQSAFPIFPSSATEFYFKVVDAQITFVEDSAGQTTSLILHQNGHDIPMPRIDSSVAAQIVANTAAKVQDQTPTPGSEAALRRLIAGIVAGKPDYDEMSPELAVAMRQQLPTLQGAISGFGAVQSVEFRGVGNQGWDIYEVKQERGSMRWHILLSSDGKIADALVSAGP